MRKYIFIAIAATVVSACDGFLELEPEFSLNESAFYKTSGDFETALIGAYSELQNIHDGDFLYLTELTTDNAEIQWSSPTTSESEADEMNVTLANTFINAIYSSSFTMIAWCNNIITKIDDVSLDESLKDQYKGEALFLRAYSYFNLVRLYGDVPKVTAPFGSPDEIASSDLSRKPVSEIYDLIISDLSTSADLLSGVSGLSKSRASEGAAKTLLGKVYLTQQEYGLCADVLDDVLAMGYTLEDDYADLFTPGNDDLSESIFEIKYLSGNIGEGNSFSSIFTPPLFNIALFPGNMQGSGRINPTDDMGNAYEDGDLRKAASFADSVLLLDDTYADNNYAKKFVDFTTGVVGDGGVNFTSLRYADVLLMYAEALNETNMTVDAHDYVNMVRDRADLGDLAGLTKADLTLAIEQERRVEFFCEGHRWFDLVRTGRAETVINAHFDDLGLNFTLEPHELLMPIPQRELDIDPDLGQNPDH